MWTELSNPSMSWARKQIVNLKWQYANINRHIRIQKSVKEGIKHWWHLRKLCKKANKTLLRMAKEMENKALNKD